MQVKIFDLGSEYTSLKDDLQGIFDEVASRGEFILGREVKGFEEAFARYIGVRHALGVGSGTDAIRIGGLAIAKKGARKIITTPNTYIASVMALSPHGFIPVLCDIDPETHNMSPASLAAVLEREKDVALCIPVHLYGHACRMDKIMEVCNAHGVPVFEDACQAHGGLFRGRKLGSFGRAAAFSFYPTKNLGCYGDGGGVVTDDDDVFGMMFRLRNYGQTDKHVHAVEGFNSRLDELQAAFLKFKLGYLDAWNEKRRHLAWLYHQGLKETPLTLPVEKEYAYHVYHLYVVRAPRRDEMMRFLAGKGITALIHYPTPIHLQPAYRHLGYKAGDFPEAEKAATEIVSLPLYPWLEEEKVAYVCDAIRGFYR